MPDEPPRYAAPPEPLPGERCFLDALMRRQLDVIDYQASSAYQSLVDGNYPANCDHCNRLDAAREDHNDLTAQFVRLYELTAN